MADQAEVLIFPDLAALQFAAAERIATLAEGAGRERGRVLLAISGGTAPPGVFRHLCDEPLRSKVPWEAVSVIWCDERLVPYDSPDSNYRQARETLLDHVPIPSLQVYPVATYYGVAQAAEVYERQVAALLEAHGGQIDIALLGMGPDGHTASLFPGRPDLVAPTGRLVLAVEGAPKPPPTRVSLGAAALNRAASAIFLVSGADKAPRVREALRGPYDPVSTPAQIVRPPTGRVTWMLDEAAAREL
ncbi:MAG: 6-phosphogluconolactonase [Chloroflexi bacterium OHK40]